MGFELLYIHITQKMISRGCRRNGAIHQIRDASLEPHAVCEAGIGGISARIYLGLGVSWHFSRPEVRFRISALLYDETRDSSADVAAWFILPPLDMYTQDYTLYPFGLHYDFNLRCSEELS